jgi:membrane dipeptidase
MVLCLSHTGYRTALEAIEYARNPCIFSHSNPYAKFDHPRNVSDELIRACAKKGGVMGLNGFGPFLGGDGAVVATLLEHLRYVIDLVGPEHVGLGLDYVFDVSELDDFITANPGMFPVGMTGRVPMVRPEDLEEITNGLARTGLSNAQIQGVMGGNWLRIAEEVWK